MPSPTPEIEVTVTDHVREVRNVHEPALEAAVADALAALLEDCGVARLDDTAWFAAAGEDRVRWLNGMTTNSIQQLKPGEGCYNFILSAQGRIQGDGTAFATSTELLFETDRTQLPKLMELLDRFIIMDDVELREQPSYGLLCAGPKASEALATLAIETNDLAAINRRRVAWRGIALQVIHGDSPLVPRFEIWASTADEREAVWSALVGRSDVGGGATGVTAVDAAALEALRILEGRPRYGVDISDRELPQETAQTRALHFAKGCYLGQEIVERIRSRGAVHRTFQAFRLDGAEAQPGDVLQAEAKEVGVLTSVATLPLAGGAVQLGLGYIRREVLDRKVTIEYGAGGVATEVETPYRSPSP